MATYTAEIIWLRGDQNFVDNKYSRRHLLRFDGGIEIQGSSSPHVVPVPYSATDAVDPEEGFVASLSDQASSSLATPFRRPVKLKPYISKRTKSASLPTQSKQRSVVCRCSTISNMTVKAATACGLRWTSRKRADPYIRV